MTKADEDDLRGQAKRNREAEEHRAALDAIQKRREEAAELNTLRGDMEFARCIAGAPSLVAAMQRLKDNGRG
jgi:hypothetical protein